MSGYVKSRRHVNDDILESQEKSLFLGCVTRPHTQRLVSQPRKSLFSGSCLVTGQNVASLFNHEKKYVHSNKPVWHLCQANMSLWPNKMQESQAPLESQSVRPPKFVHCAFCSGGHAAVIWASRPVPRIPPRMQHITLQILAPSLYD